MSQVEVSRCTGHCCEDFTLQVSPMQFAWWKKLISAGKRIKHLDRDEVAKVADMVVFLRSDKTCKNNIRRKIDHILYHYTCRHFDPKTKNCMNYEDRPNMCRAYPNGGVCKYNGCTRVCDNRPTPEDMAFDEKMKCADAKV